ncbi:MAG: hypothetical protein AB7O24_06640 [Kofleriaceae bacterium]
MATDSTRWLRRTVALVLIVIGWLFISWQNNFNATAAVVFADLGWLAIVLTVYNLWRTGAVAASVQEDDDSPDSTWTRPIGERAELEREKKILLKAIKETEFDLEMGKLSKVDAEEMTARYRAKAIDLIKEIDRIDGKSSGTIREQIEREVKARVELRRKSEAQGKDLKNKPANKPGKPAAASSSEPAAESSSEPATESSSEPATEPSSDVVATTSSESTAPAKEAAE